jgi:hypothetical protein
MTTVYGGISPADAVVAKVNRPAVFEEDFERQKRSEKLDDAGEPAPEDLLILKNCHIS